MTTDHIIASTTEPARLLAVLIVDDSDEQLVIPDLSESAAAATNR